MRLFKQSPSMCGPTSLRILLSHYTKKTYSEKGLQKLTGATKKDGVGHQGMRDALAKLGYDDIEERQGEDVWKSLEAGESPAVCGVWSPGNSKKEGCGHYVVVYRVKHGRVVVYDPEFEDVRILTKRAFDNIWFDEESNTEWRQWMLFIKEGRKHER